MVTFALVILFVAIAMVALSVGVILKKKTPLKGHCHKPVDGSDGCGACGNTQEEVCDATLKRDDIKQGKFQIETASRKIDLRQ